ncbi:MAG: metallophosphoesterase family protein [Bacteroidota bacterium]
MIKIGLLSDTHNFVLPQAADFFSSCNEIWHAGDIGNYEVIQKLREIKPVKAVYGNIDGQDIRCEFPEFQCFKAEDITVLMIHIGGYPGKYDKYAYSLIQKYQPTIFISGHSHILKVINDPKNNLLHINPGAAGKYGFQQKKTMIRFNIDKAKISDLEVFDCS